MKWRELWCKRRVKESVAYGKQYVKVNLTDSILFKISLNQVPNETIQQHVWSTVIKLKLNKVKVTDIADTLVLRVFKVVRVTQHICVTERQRRSQWSSSIPLTSNSNAQPGDWLLYLFPCIMKSQIQLREFF